MKKVILIAVSLMLAALMAFGLTACGEKSKGSSDGSEGGNTPKNYDVAELADKIHDNCSFEDEYLQKVDDADFALSLFNVDPSCVEESKGGRHAAVYISGAYPELIFCVKAVDEASASKIQDAVKAKLDSYMKDYGTYGPDQLSKIESAVFRSSGLYIIYAVTNDNAAASGYIDSIFGN